MTQKELMAIHRDLPSKYDFITQKDFISLYKFIKNAEGLDPSVALLKTNLDQMIKANLTKFSQYEALVLEAAQAVKDSKERVGHGSNAQNKAAEQFINNENNSLKEKVRVALNKKNADNPRIKMGYPRRDWKRIIGRHRMMDAFMAKIIPNYVTDLITDGLQMESEEGTALFKKYDKQFRDYVRKEIIPGYPGAKDRQDVRERLMLIFNDKVKEILDQNDVPVPRNNPVF